MNITGLMMLIISVFVSLSFGSVETSFSDVWESMMAPTSTDLMSRIIIDLRLPRVILALLAGVGLAVTGQTLQTVTRNPLADPYLFGISSGASFGAVAFTILAASVGVTASLAASLGITAFAFTGAAASVFLVLILSGVHQQLQVERMLLSGVAISFMFSAFSSLLLYFAQPQAAASVLFWGLGSFTQANWEMLLWPTIVVTCSILALQLLQPWINTLQLGDETAQTLGVPVQKLRLSVLLICSLITAVLVANCGGIGFVGLMIPHLVRMIFRTNSLALSGLVGGIFMVWVDVLARTLLSSQELPVGIITTALGSVFFIGIMSRKTHS
nr:iron ABC transporter permease [Parashewanella tropica]